jgi:hypothetical protein
MIINVTFLIENLNKRVKFFVGKPSFREANLHLNLNIHKKEANTCDVFAFFQLGGRMGTVQDQVKSANYYLGDTGYAI